MDTDGSQASNRYIMSFLSGFHHEVPKPIAFTPKQLVATELVLDVPPPNSHGPTSIDPRFGPEDHIDSV